MGSEATAEVKRLSEILRQLVYFGDGVKFPHYIPGKNADGRYLVKTSSDILSELPHHFQFIFIRIEVMRRGQYRSSTAGLA